MFNPPSFSVFVVSLDTVLCMDTLTLLSLGFMYVMDFRFSELGRSICAVFWCLCFSFDEHPPIVDHFQIFGTWTPRFKYDAELLSVSCIFDVYVSPNQRLQYDLVMIDRARFVPVRE